MGRRKPILLSVACERTDVEKLRRVLRDHEEFVLRFEHDGDHMLTIELSSDACPAGEGACFEFMLRRALERCAACHKAPSTFPPRMV